MRVGKRFGAGPRRWRLYPPRWLERDLRPQPRFYDFKFAFSRSLLGRKKDITQTLFYVQNAAQDELGLFLGQVT